MSIKNEILDKQRENWLAGLKTLLTNDVEKLGKSPLAGYGIDTEEIWASIIEAGTQTDEMFVKLILNFTEHCFSQDPKATFEHTRWVKGFLVKWVKDLKAAGEIENTDDFNNYYGLQDFHIRLGE